jgi:acetolactate synthase-1/2/3 large subunit
VALAKAYGLHATRVEKTADFAAALDTALLASTGALIEVITEPEAISVRTSITKIRESAMTRLAH